MNEVNPLERRVMRLCKQEEKWKKNTELSNVVEIVANMETVSAVGLGATRTINSNGEKKKAREVCGITLDMVILNAYETANGQQPPWLTHNDQGKVLATTDSDKGD